MSWSAIPKSIGCVAYVADVAPRAVLVARDDVGTFIRVVELACAQDGEVCSHNQPCYRDYTIEGEFYTSVGSVDILSNDSNSTPLPATPSATIVDGRRYDGGISYVHSFVVGTKSLAVANLSGDTLSLVIDGTSGNQTAYIPPYGSFAVELASAMVAGNSMMIQGEGNPVSVIVNTSGYI